MQRLAHPTLITPYELERLHQRTQRKSDFEKNRRKRELAKTNLEKAKAEEKEIRKQKQLVKTKKASNKETKSLTEEHQILALQQVQQEDLREARASTQIETGFKLTAEQCEKNKQRKASATTRRGKERIRKAISAENEICYRNYCISVQILLAVEARKQGNTSSATNSSPRLTRAVQAYQQEAELGGVRRVSEYTANGTRHNKSGGTTAAPHRPKPNTVMNTHSSLAPDYPSSHKDPSLGLGLCCKRTIVLFTVIFTIVLIIVFLRIFNIIDIIGPYFPDIN